MIATDLHADLRSSGLSCPRLVLVTDPVLPQASSTPRIRQIPIISAKIRYLYTIVVLSILKIGLSFKVVPKFGSIFRIQIPIEMP